MVASHSGLVRIISTSDPRIHVGIVVNHEMDDMVPPDVGRIYLYLGTDGWHSEWNLKSGQCYDDVPEDMRIHPEDLARLRQ